MGVQFGKFDSICETAALVICPLVGTDQGIVPTCYSRNVDIGGTLIFQPCMFDLLLTLSSLTIPSDILCAYRRHHHDRHYDSSHSLQIHRRRPQRNRHVLLDVRAHPIARPLPGFWYHSNSKRSLSSMYGSAKLLLMLTILSGSRRYTSASSHQRSAVYSSTHLSASSGLKTAHLNPFGRFASPA